MSEVQWDYENAFLLMNGGIRSGLLTGLPEGLKPQIC